VRATRPPAPAFGSYTTRDYRSAKFILGEPGVANDAAHAERIYWIMSRNREDPDTVGHHNILSLPGNPKACLLQSADGVLMVDARNPLHGLSTYFYGHLSAAGRERLLNIIRQRMR